MRICSFARSLACLGVGVLLTASLSQTAPLDPEQLAGEGTVKAAATPEQIAFFEKSIRPVLVKECYTCHAATAEKIRGGLTLDTRDGMRKGGDSGPAVAPGDTKGSLMLQAIRYANDDLKMPPKKKLDDAVIADFEKWVA